jgi:type VI secretion system protein ImpA
MAVPEVAALLAPLAGENPSGPDLHYDAAFRALEDAASAKAGGMVGSAEQGADGPNWALVLSQAVALLERSKDLRTASYLTLALLHREGVSGFAAGLHLVFGLLETQWASLHPVPDGADDPSRATALAALSVAPVLATLRRAPLITSRVLGPLSLNDIAPLSGSADTARIAAIFEEAPLADLDACAAFLQGGLDDLQGIDRVFQAHAPEHGPDQGSLLQYFQQALRAVRARIEERRSAEQIAPAAADLPAAASARGLSGDIVSREDVVRAFDKISSYFERHEPSSPIPLLVERCKRLVSMSFLEIMSDLAPDGLKQAHLVVGKPGDGK